jgi:hypothetical protein
MHVKAVEYAEIADPVFVAYNLLVNGKFAF